jgi:peptidyl-prolyl cis-trans isomerase D
MQQEIERLNIKVEDAQVVKYINEMPAIASVKNTDGSINVDKLTVLLQQQGLSIEQFQTRVKYLLTNQYLAENIAKSSLIPTQVQENIAKGLLEKRDIQFVNINASDFSAKVELKPESLSKYYNEHVKDFISKPKVDLEYVILNKQDLTSSVANPADADIKKYYDENITQFKTQEERRASHILIKIDNNKKEDAKLHATKVLQEVRMSPEKFGELAKKESSDTISAEKNGDLDYFVKGAMVKPFEDAVFKMKVGEISDLVESEFGFHIIKLTDIKSSVTKSLDDEKSNIIQVLKQKQVDDLFAKKLDELTNSSIDSKNLDSVGKKLGLSLKTAGGIGKTGNTEQTFTDRRAIRAIFEDDVLKGKKNTDVIQSGDYAFVARVTKYYPSKQQTFEESIIEVKEKFLQEESLKLAKQNGVAKLAAAKQGEALAWSPVQTATRMEGKFSKQVIETIFTANSASLPSYVGVPVEAGYALFKISKVEVIPADQNIIQMVKQFGNAYASEELQALLTNMRHRYGVEVVKDVTKIKLSS